MDSNGDKIVDVEEILHKKSEKMERRQDKDSEDMCNKIVQAMAESMTSLSDNLNKNFAILANKLGNASKLANDTTIGSLENTDNSVETRDGNPDSRQITARSGSSDNTRLSNTENYVEIEDDGERSEPESSLTDLRQLIKKQTMVIRDATSMCVAGKTIQSMDQMRREGFKVSLNQNMQTG